jgi:hypothetical protein
VADSVSFATVELGCGLRNQADDLCKHMQVWGEPDNREGDRSWTREVQQPSTNVMNVGRAEDAESRGDANKF